MKLIPNVGNDRVIDELRNCLGENSELDLATPAFSLFAFAETRELLERVRRCRMVLPGGEKAELGLLGSEGDRPFRNRLNARWLARKCREWIEKRVEVRQVPGPLPQCLLLIENPDSEKRRGITGICPFTTDGLGLTSGNQFGLVQASERSEECDMYGGWFGSLWNGLPDAGAKADLLRRLQELVAHKPPALAYHLILYHLFKDLGTELDEEKIVKSATGIRNTVVWKKLFKFQRDGVVGAIDKLERLGGCIIADSVGWGRRSRRWRSSNTTSCETTACWCWCRSGSATTGRCTRPTTAGTSWRRTGCITTC